MKIGGVVNMTEKQDCFHVTPPVFLSTRYLVADISSELCQGSVRFRGDGCGGWKLLFTITKIDFAISVAEISFHSRNNFSPPPPPPLF
jgi:hypothetical protein